MLDLQFSTLEVGSLSRERWNALVADLPASPALPAPHLLQSWEWAQVKARYGWQPSFCTWSERQGGAAPRAATLLLQRTIAPGGLDTRLRVMYLPKGPLLSWEDPSLRGRVLDDLAALARRRGAIFMKMDPDLVLGVGVPGEPGMQEFALGSQVVDELARRGWRYSPDQIQFRNTVIVDLTRNEEELLAGMKQKMRYNIRLAQRKGVQVRCGTEADFPLLYRMYAETSVRDGFVIREAGYYQALWGQFLRAGLLEPLIAEVDDAGSFEPVAAVMIFRYAGRAYYLYGMSREQHREKMPNALLQWEAMRRARAAGCRVYDLWGAPENFVETDPLWGVYRFKEGLGGQVVRTLGAWDLPTRPQMYLLYTRILPRLLEMMRRRARGQARTLTGL